MRVRGHQQKEMGISVTASEKLETFCLKKSFRNINVLEMEHLFMANTAAPSESCKTRLTCISPAELMEGQEQKDS